MNLSAPWLAPVLRLIAVVLLVQTVLAPALCLGAGMEAGRGVVAVEICTAEGLRTIHAAPDGTPAEPPGLGHVGACLVCHALPQGAGLDLPPLPVPAWIAIARLAAAATPDRLPPGIRGPPSGARAPPVLS
ncbi:MAG: hypothetical protein JWP04_3952 [Belnapia sp.]|nr:hypothetical protein [Belnapia sp.]